MKYSPAGNADDGSSATSSPGEVVQTAAEKAREKRLRDDPMADVLGPHFVSCRRCGNHIKLSPKSTYDPFHWQKHRERCLKKPAGLVKKRREMRDALTAPYKKPSTSTLDSTTPPLSTDDDDDMARPDRFKEESPSLAGGGGGGRGGGGSWSNNPAPPTRKLVTPVRQSDMMFREYMIRTRRKLDLDFSPPVEPWNTWDWSQLTMPVWVVATYPDRSKKDGGDRPSTSEKPHEQTSDATTTGASGTLHDEIP